MWTYEDITREEFEKRKDYVEKVMVELGAVPTEHAASVKVSTYANNQLIGEHTSNRTIYIYQEEYYRVCEMLYKDKPFIVIEFAESLERALSNCMEDIDPFPHDLSDNEIVKEVKCSLGIY
ncbi:MAG: hypothetical protein IJA01_06565 [Firmicutes bacterium]|nr:hypothetical protein [Bacillota bacterium]